MMIFGLRMGSRRTYLKLRHSRDSSRKVWGVVARRKGVLRRMMSGRIGDVCNFKSFVFFLIEF